MEVSPVGTDRVDEALLLRVLSAVKDGDFSARLPAPGDAVIVRSTIDLAHNLGLTVVAEGVEEEATLDILSDYGCDCAQGYYFHRPCAAEELTEWLTDSRFGAQIDAVRT